MNELYELFGILKKTVDLGFIELPVYVLIFLVLILLGLGLRRSWLSLSGVFLIFAYYILTALGVLE